MSWEERFYEDVLPEIEAYTREETSSFTSGDIAERLEDYTPQKVGKTLKYMTEKEGTSHVIRTGNNPKTWEAVLLEGTAWERLGYELEAEPQPREPEEIAEEVLEENPEEEEESLYARFIDRLEEKDQFRNTAESIRKMRDIAERKRPEIDPEIKELSEQEYGRLRNNIENVYEGLKEIKEERNSYFKTRDLKKKVEGVRAQEIGLVLSGLTAAGLVNKYSDRELYEPDSIDLESIREFQRAVKHAENFETLQNLLEFKEK